MLSDFDKWRETPIDIKRIPENDDASVDADEPLVLIADYGVVALHSYQGPEEESPDVYLRQTVAQKLQSINDILDENGLELVIREGWRSLEEQINLWETTLKRAQDRYKNLSFSDILKKAETLCINPYPGDSISSHQTGGAIDCTIRYKNNEKQPLVMSHDDVLADERDITDHCETNQNEPWMHEAQTHRRLLYHAMASEGFVNYYKEWWHYEWGTSSWAKMQAGEPEHHYKLIKQHP